MLVKDLMIKPIVASPNDSFYETWKLVSTKKLRVLPIVDKQNYLLGVISEEDLIGKLYPSYTDYLFDPVRARDFEYMEKKVHSVGHLTAAEVMNKNVVVTEADVPILKAASKMLINQVSCLPVIRQSRDKQKLVGVVCKEAICSALFDKYMIPKKGKTRKK